MIMTTNNNTVVGTETERTRCPISRMRSGCNILTAENGIMVARNNHESILRVKNEANLLSAHVSSLADLDHP